MPIPPPARDPATRRVPLPQARPRLPRGPTRIGRWRCAVLIAVHVLIAAHIAHWLVNGRTVGRLVLSDSMRTLESGEVNPGFLLFGGALLVTAVCGRFLCGWACHMGALQDLCAWTLRKVGVRPHRFNSRLLAWAPVAAGVYMFIWPTFRRGVLVPVLQAVYPEAVAWIGPWHPFPGLSSSMTTTDLWTGLPGAWVAVPFFLVCGVATVYFLGSRGFCRYACPYGGIFRPVERIAPARVVVDPALCDRCGLCTAACTTGVRVMEETGAYGKVIDDRCTRSLDCISVCPNQALSLGWGGPALLRRQASVAPPRRVFDLSWGGELAAAAVFLTVFFTTRGLYGVIPLMMALGIAACVTAILWKAVRTLLEPNSRLAPWQLRRAAAMRPAGVVFLGSSAILTAVLVHSAVVRSIQFMAGVFDGRVTVPADVVFSKGVIPAEQRAIAERGLRWYGLARPWREGGLALASTPAADRRAAWLALVAGRPADAQQLLVAAMGREGASASTVADLARIDLLRDDMRGAVERLAAFTRGHRDDEPTHDLLESLYEGSGRLAEAIDLARAWVRSHPGDSSRRARLGVLLVRMGDGPASLVELSRAAAEAPGEGWIRLWLGIAQAMCGRTDEAVESVLRAGSMDPRLGEESRRTAADILMQAGREREARERGLVAR